MAKHCFDLADARWVRRLFLFHACNNGVHRRVMKIEAGQTRFAITNFTKGIRMLPKTIALELVDRDPEQPRQFMDLHDLEQLSGSIADLGQLQPIVVYQSGDRFITIDGHRRVESVRMLDREHVFALVLEEKPDDDTLLMTQLAANCMRIDLRPTEKAQAFQRLKDSKGWSNAQLAEAVHISKSAVTQLLSFLRLPEEAQSMLDAGELPHSTAYAISRAPDVATQQSLLDKAANGGLKRDDAQRVVSRKRSRKTGSKSRVAFRLELADVAISSSEKLDISECVAVLQHLIKECRKAGKQGLDVQTFSKVLSDQQSQSLTNV